MAELNFNFYCLISVILILQLEFFFMLGYNNIIFFTKQLLLTKSFKNIHISIFSNSNLFFYLFVFFFIFWKSSTNYPFVWLFYFLFFIFLTERIVKTLEQKLHSHTNYFSNLLPLFVGFLFFIFLIKSFLVFFFFLELYGVLYYFVFLTTYNFSNQTILKYKNGIMMLLWNNFLTTFFLAVGVFFLIKLYGTSDFTELAYINNTCMYIYIYLFGLAWKVGLPLFHFFKVEMYKILLKENVFLFSILTTLINFILFYYLFSQPIVFNSIYLYNWFFIVFIIIINLIIINLKLFNFLFYFALSGVLTISTLLVIFLI